MRCSVAFAVSCVILTSLAAADPAAAAIKKQTNIPAQGLGSALQTLASERELQVLYRTEIVGDRYTPGAAGELTVAEALSTLLDATGLTYEYLDDKTITILPTGSERAAAGEPAASRANLPGASAKIGQEGAQRSFFERFRLAQADQRTAASSASAETPRNGSREAATPGNEMTLQEIIVTATRRAESILNVPLSISALDTDQLTNSNVKSIGDLFNVVPGVQFSPGGAMSPTGTGISVRGVGGLSGDATTGIYIDDVAIQGTRPAGTTSGFGDTFPGIFDLDRVEVLRGPQGTLFGAGAMGGAVRFIQKQPSLTTFSGRAVGELATTHNGGMTYETGLAFGGPIVTDKLGFRTSFWQRRDGGYVDWVNPFSGDLTDKDSDRSTTTAARLAATWAPTDALKITPSLLWQDVRVNNTVSSYHGYYSNLRTADYRNAGLVRLPATDKFWSASLTMEADLGFADLIAVSGYFRREAESSGYSTPILGQLLYPLIGMPEGFGNPLGPAFPVSYDDLAKQATLLDRRSVSQEVRLSSNDPEARLTWTVGAYYANTKQDESTGQVVLPLFPPYLEMTQVELQQTSAFAQADLRIVAGLKATLGVRVAKFAVDMASRDVFANLENYHGSQEDTPVIPKFGLEYQADPRNLFYASAGKGFRSGGINQPIGRVVCPGGSDEYREEYASDTLWSYEVGAKNRLFNDRVTVSSSVYRIKWSDIQTDISIAACADGFVANAGEAVIEGFDSAISMVVIPQRLRADLAFAYVDAQYSKDVNTATGLIVKSGYALGEMSPWTVTASLEYSFDMLGNEAFARAEHIYRSKNTDPLLIDLPRPGWNPELRPNPTVNILNLRGGVTLDRVQLALFMTNALNAHPTLGWENFAEGGSFTTANTLTPRTTGINVNYSF